LHEVFSELDFRTALDAFSGSGCVSYLLKSMGKEVHANDFLNFCTVLAQATSKTRAFDSMGSVSRGKKTTRNTRTDADSRLSYIC
jgi:adenine-specific DNA methylase